MNKGLDRPVFLKAGRTYRLKLIVDDTIATIYIDGVALNTRMYTKPGDSLGIYVTDGCLELENASISKSLKK
jgi:beta-fructofuranosidase